MFRFFTVIGVFLSLNVSYVGADDQKAYEYNQKGVEYLSEKKHRLAIDNFKKALQESPDNEKIKTNLALAYNNYGFLFQKNGQPINAVDNFEKSLKYAPENMYTLINLIGLYYDNNDMKQAAYYLEISEKIDPNFPGLKEFKNKLSKEVPVEKDLKKTETVHFLIVSDEKVDVNSLSNVKIILEQAYSRVGSFYDLFPKEKLTVVLYSEKDYDKSLGDAPYWVMAFFDGKIRIPLSEKKYSKNFLRRIIYHEYTHALVRYITKANAPLWLNEGLATYSESFVSPMDKYFLKDYINRRTFVPFNELPSDYSQIKGQAWANLLYREFFLLASFLVDKYGAGTVKDILEDLGQGKDIIKVFEKRLQLSYNDFGENWGKYVFSKLSI
jgi:tetratricopeptide (TPR) repeat protein